MLPWSLTALLFAATNFKHAFALPTQAATEGTSAIAIARRHADFSNVRTRLRQDHSGVKGDPSQKYFHEATFHPHYDGRFADKALPEEKRDHALTSLVQTYLSTMEQLGAETWLMHGSLLGWWWNRKIMPWDSDIDVQMSLDSINYLAAYHNMTMHHFQLPAEHKQAIGGKDDMKIEEDKAADSGPRVRDYLLEINPNYSNGSTKDRLNKIDARWIDTETGLFIDITVLRPKESTNGEDKLGKMECKDGHHYLEQDIFPLRMSTFEGVPAKIPYAYSELLEEEYGRASLTKTSYEGHLFDSKTQAWIPFNKVGSNPVPNVNQNTETPKPAPASSSSSNTPSAGQRKAAELMKAARPASDKPKTP